MRNIFNSVYLDFTYTALEVITVWTTDIKPHTNTITDRYKWNAATVKYEYAIPH